MAEKYYLIKESTLTRQANKARQLLGTTTTYTPLQIVSAMDSIAANSNNSELDYDDIRNTTYEPSLYDIFEEDDKLVFYTDEGINHLFNDSTIFKIDSSNVAYAYNINSNKLMLGTTLLGIEGTALSSYSNTVLTLSDGYITGTVNSNTKIICISNINGTLLDIPMLCVLDNNNNTIVGNTFGSSFILDSQSFAWSTTAGTFSVNSNGTYSISWAIDPNLVFAAAIDNYDSISVQAAFLI